jgi:hypothetical protein
MIDTFKVVKNEVGVPASDRYESKDLGCTLAYFRVNSDGIITLEESGSNYNGNQFYEHAVMGGKLTYRNLNIYTLNAEGNLDHYFLTVVENQIVRVSTPDATLFMNDDYMFALGESNEVLIVGKICHAVDDLQSNDN